MATGKFVFYRVTDLGVFVEKGKKVKKEKDKKEKTKMKQDEVDIKPVTLQDLMTEAKMVKQEIKEDNSTNIDEQNIAEIVNFRDFSKPLVDSPVTGIIMIDPPDLPIDKEDIDINVSNNNKINSNKQNSLSLIDRVIFQKRDKEIILIINKEFSLTKVALIDSSADNMNCIQERLIPLKYYEKSFEQLTQTNEEKLIITYVIREYVLKLFLAFLLMI